MNDPGIEVRTYFGRGRNVLVARAEFSELYAAWYLHRMDCGITLPPNSDQIGRDALAAITLHCASRPHGESCAWTVHFAGPRMNVFAAGDNSRGTVVANVFTDNVAELATGRFYADVAEAGQPARRSVVDFSGTSFLEAAETFYTQSEQRPARFFWHTEEDLVMISAQPDCDLEWLAALDVEAVRQLDSQIELALLETRHIRFECGCNQGRMLDFLVPVFRRQGDELFGDEPTIRIHCPRCGAKHTITREALEARSGIQPPPAASQ
ncbi:MAG: Hsp33 family molecular chaperone HslO [Terrimicrobiaceae bacterium]|jgi:molecular chaperone Hsp33